jgi:hypothetical protein
LKSSVACGATGARKEELTNLLMQAANACVPGEAVDVLPPSMVQM